MVAKTQRGTWWFFVLLVLLLGVIWVGLAAVRTDECPKDLPREWQWLPPHWDCSVRY